jgi:hypothetical protein
MRDLSIFFKIVFLGGRVSYEDLRKFTEIAIQRISLNNPGGIYTPLLTLLVAAYTAYFGDLSDEETKKALKEGSTITMNNALQAFIQWVRTKEGIISGTFGIGSAGYQEFYPHGMMEYTNLTLANALVIMKRYIDVATLRQAELPANFLEDVTNLRDVFEHARTQQNQLISQVETERTEKYGTRLELETVLMKCILFIAYNNVGNINAVDLYFDQSFLKASKPKVFENVLQKGKTEFLYKHEFDTEDEIKAENTGNTPWLLSLCLTQDEVPATGVTVAPGESIKLTADKFGDVDANIYLIIKNLDADHDGKYKITV